MQDRAERRAELQDFRKGELADYLLDGVKTPGGAWRANVGPKSQLMKWRKDEIVEQILDAEFGT